MGSLEKEKLLMDIVILTLLLSFFVCRIIRFLIENNLALYF